KLGEADHMPCLGAQHRMNRYNVAFPEHGAKIAALFDPGFGHGFGADTRAVSNDAHAEALRHPRHRTPDAPCPDKPKRTAREIEPAPLRLRHDPAVFA